MVCLKELAILCYNLGFGVFHLSIYDREIAMSEFSNESGLSTSVSSRKTVNGFPNMIQMKLNEVDRVMKGMELPRNPKTQSEDASPLRFYDDLYAYRTTTKWPPMTGKWPTESPNRIIIDDFNNKLDHALDNFNNKLSYQQERLNYYNNDFAKRIKKIDLKSKLSSMKLPDVHRYERPSDGLETIGYVVGIIFMLFLIIFSARKKKRTQPGTVLLTGRVLEPGVVQRNQEIPMRSPVQGAVPPNIGMPHSNCFNKNFNEEPPPYPGDTVPLVNNNGFVEMGFQNECIAMPTPPNDLKTEFVTDNGKTVESLNVGMQKNQAGQGFRRADDKDSVKYVDEKSLHN